MNRRNFLQTLAGSSAALPWLGSRLEASPEKSSKQKLVLSAPLTHSDWMLRDVPWGAPGIKHMLDACKSAGWTRIYWRVLEAGLAVYRSKLVLPARYDNKDHFWNPQSETDKAYFRRYINATEEYRQQIVAKLAKLNYTDFDTLAEAVRYGHEIGLEIHAWVALNEDDHGWGWESDFALKHPECRWYKRDGTRYRSQLSFSFPEVREYKLGILKELLRYDIDGLFLDWIRTGDVRDNPQNDAEGVADYGYERPLVEKFKKKYRQDPREIPNNDERWVRLRAEPQTEFMRAAKKLARKRRVPLAVMVAHPWSYRGEQNKIDSNLRGMLLDTATWGREKLADSYVAAGYYMSGGDAEKAWQALRQETGGKSDVWTYAWVPTNPAQVEESIALARKVGAQQILFWEADYIESATPEVKAALRKHAGM